MTYNDKLQVGVKTFKWPWVNRITRAAYPKDSCLPKGQAGIQVFSQALSGGSKHFLPLGPGSPTSPLSPSNPGSPSKPLSPGFPLEPFGPSCPLFPFSPL